MDIIDQMKERIAIVESQVGDRVKSFEFTQAEVPDLMAENEIMQSSDHENGTLIDKYKWKTWSSDKTIRKTTIVCRTCASVEFRN